MMCENIKFKNEAELSYPKACEFTRCSMDPDWHSSTSVTFCSTILTSSDLEEVKAQASWQVNLEPVAGLWYRTEHTDKQEAP